MRQESISPENRQRLANIDLAFEERAITENQYRDTRRAILIEDDSKEAWRWINATLPQKNRHRMNFKWSH
jgi:hypothetical protein